MSSRRPPYLTFGMCCLLLHLSDLPIDRTSVVWKAAHAASSRLSAKTHLRHFPRLECQAPQQTEANKAPKSVGPKPTKTCIQKTCLETYNLDLRAQRFLPVHCGRPRGTLIEIRHSPHSPHSPYLPWASKLIEIRHSPHSPHLPW